MTKQIAFISQLEILLDAHLSVPLYKQLYERFRLAILSGHLEAGARLPSTRQLASELGISRTTVVLAYEHLVSEGYLECRIGQGTVVASQLSTFLLNRRAGLAQKERGGIEVLPPRRLASRVYPLQQVISRLHFEGSPRSAYRGNEPAVDKFPYDLWARLLARRARQSLQAMASYQSPAGYFPLREAIATHIGITRGVHCLPEQVIITAGAQGALDLAARTLLNPGDAVWLENPGYFGAQGALLSAGARLVPVPVDEQGLDVAQGRQRSPQARLALTTPSHQFPTGVTMSLSRRLALVQWAREADGWIVEDDYDSEYRWSGRPLEALAGLDQNKRVLYVGTFSKVLFPALRLGYLVAPPELMEPLLTTRYFIDVHIPLLEQMALCDFLREGYYARYLHQMRDHYRAQRQLLQTALCSQLNGFLQVHAPEAGLRLVGWLPPGKDDQRAAEQATEVGVEVAPLSRYSLEPLPRGGLLFGFGYTAMTEQELLLGVKKLAAVLSQSY